MKKNCILVTGATGFVGRHVVRSLLADGKRVRAVVRPGKEGRVQDLGGSVETILTDDIFSETSAWWKEAYREVDTVVHLAWYLAKGAAHLNDEKNFSCLTGTIMMAREAVVCDVRRFVGAGTYVEYDSKYGAALDVSTPLLPEALYAATKVAVFVTLKEFLRGNGVEFAWCRIFSMYGDQEHCLGLDLYLHEQLSAGKAVELTRGEQIRDYLDVSEAGEMIKKVALGTIQGAVNICSGKPVTVRAFAERVADTYGRRDLLLFGKRAPNPVDPPIMVGVRDMELFGS